MKIKKIDFHLKLISEIDKQSMIDISFKGTIDAYIDTKIYRDIPIELFTWENKCYINPGTNLLSQEIINEINDSLSINYDKIINSLNSKLNSSFKKLDLNILVKELKRRK